MYLDVDGVSASYGCESASFSVDRSEIFSIIGPNGAGKTTLLNLIAGFVKTKSGKIFLNGVRIDSLPPQKRNIGYLPQGENLLPHLDVKDNLLFPLKCRKFSEKARREKLEEWIERFKLHHLLEKYPYQLSGGERRKVSIAQALIYDPNLLLLDEPSNRLDLQTQKRLRMEVKRIKKEFAVSVIYVTHNMIEAEELSDRVGVMINGRLIQSGPLKEVMKQPASVEIANFFGRPNIIPCESAKRLNGCIYEVVCSGFKLLVISEEKPEYVLIYPWDVYISSKEPPGPFINRLKGRIVAVKKSFSGERLITVDVNGTKIDSFTTLSVDAMPLKRGEELYLILKLRNLRAVY